MRHRRDSRLAARFTACLLLIAASSLAAHALPPGYKDDFNGCATQSADDTDRERCCTETRQQCSGDCGDSSSSGPGDTEEHLACLMDCLEGYLKCSDGRVITIVAWPGDPTAVVPGLTSKDDHLLPDARYELVASRNAVVVDLRGKDPATADNCVAFVVACQCPASVARGQECRAWMDGKGTACRICRRGAPTESCKPCPDCRPELLSAQSCGAPSVQIPSGRHDKAGEGNDPAK